jgi:hypothetical protein
MEAFLLTHPLPYPSLVLCTDYSALPQEKIFVIQSVQDSHVDKFWDFLKIHIQFSNHFLHSETTCGLTNGPKVSQQRNCMDWIC